MLKNISNFYNTGDYLSILNGCITIDLIMICLLYGGIYKSVYLKKWYEIFQVSAFIADVLIIFIGIIITRFLYTFFISDYSLLKFIVLAVIVQLIHDSSFYLFFYSIPKGKNTMIDFFKVYAIEMGSSALVGDAFMIIMASIFSSYFASLSVNTNIIILVFIVYLVPYLINF